VELRELHEHPRGGLGLPARRGEREPHRCDRRAGPTEQLAPIRDAA
jgi:hypothetical protein